MLGGSEEEHKGAAAHLHKMEADLRRQQQDLLLAEQKLMEAQQNAALFEGQPQKQEYVKQKAVAEQKVKESNELAQKALDLAREAQRSTGPQL